MSGISAVRKPILQATLTRSHWSLGNMLGEESRGWQRAISKQQWPKLEWMSQILLVVAFFTVCIHASATPVFLFVFSKLLSTFVLPTNQRMALMYSIAILRIAAIDGILSYLFHFLLEYCAQIWTAWLVARRLDR